MKKKQVRIHTIPVELYKILKFENLCASGGEAKHLIAQGQVRVNSKVQTQKRKKIFPGDTIEACGVIMEINKENDA